MKPASFDYVRVRTLDEVCRLLAGSGAEDTQILAGGQSLVPLMALRLARPDRLIDIGDVAELCEIRKSDGSIEIGAAVRQRDVERDPEIARSLPLLSQALPQVGHIQTRNRGTIGGSLAHADPSAEIPLVAVALTADITLACLQGRRTLTASEFFSGPMMTARKDDECLVSVTFPLWIEHDLGASFLEVSPRQGDYALVSTAVQLALDGGRCCRAAVGVGGCSPVPLRLVGVEQALLNNRLADVAFDDIAILTADKLDPEDTNQASADYRRRVAPALVRRAIEQAWRKALA